MLDRIDSVLYVDHIGYAVKDIESSKKIFNSLGYEFDQNRVDEERKVNVSVGKLGSYRVELLAPLDGVNSPIDGYLSKVGSTPYHICYVVSDMNNTIEELKEIGFTQIGYPSPSIPLGGNVCFLYSNEIGMVELIKYDNAI